MPKDEGLHHLTHRQFGDKVESCRKQEGGPAGFNDRGEQQGQGSGDERAHIGYEAHEHGKDAPHDGARHTD
jgi:hypothetical protein